MSPASRPPAPRDGAPGARLSISEAARRSGVSAKMIRHYESLGLLPAVARTEAGYRQYGEREVHTLRFIRRARDLGFAMAEIAELLALWQDRGRASAQVKRIALRHIDALDRRMAELQQMRDTLAHLADGCHGDDRPDCPILDDLGGAAAQPAEEAVRPSTSRGTDLARAGASPLPEPACPDTAPRPTTRSPKSCTSSSKAGCAAAARARR